MGIRILDFLFLFTPADLLWGKGSALARGGDSKIQTREVSVNKKGQENVTWGETCCQRFHSVLPLPADGAFSHGRVPAMSSPGHGGQECLLPSCPTGQALGERFWKDKQQSPLLAKATQSRPRAPSSLAPFGSWWGSHAPHMREQQQRGSQHPLGGTGFSPDAWMVGWAGG